MRSTRVAGTVVATLAISALAWALSAALPRPALAACGDPPDTPEAVFVFTPPQVNFVVSGTPPLTVATTWNTSLVAPKGSTASISWGDGAISPFFAEDCGADEINWPSQTFRHVFGTPGPYAVMWHVNVVDPTGGAPLKFDVLITQVVVEAAQAPTATPTPPPQPTPTAAAPTATPVGPTPTQPAAGIASPTVVTTAGVTTSPTAAPSASPSSTPARTAATATATPTAPTIAASAGGTTPKASAPTEAAREPDLPEALTDLPRIDQISTDGGTIATNIALAGVTLWVLFSSVLLNQVLQDHRAEFDERTARLMGPLRRLRKPGGRTMAGALVSAGIVLGVTGVIYGFLSPHFGVNRASTLLVLSAVIGVGIMTYACSGIEALLTRRWLGVAAAVRPFPTAIVVAATSVAISRLVNLQPGVMYGFVASVAAAPVAVDKRRQGMITAVPVLAALALSIIALLVVEPIRSSESASSSFLGQLVIGAGIVVFIGGIEGVAFNMIPFPITDGGKLFAWRKPVWAAIALLSAFLTWHVLLNRDRQSFDALRKASSASVLAVFLLYTGVSVGLWAYFRWRNEPAPLPEGEVVPPG